jgi:NRAMP (natural resistance-associated macrophage protein)-like metal ion transporter
MANPKTVNTPNVGNPNEPDRKYSFMELLRTIGPGAVVCATIIGPGTVTTCTLAGVNFEYALIWAAVFATIAAIILQMISSRLGIASGRSLGEVIYDTYDGTWLRYLFAVIIFVCLGFGNSAFQSGNMAGAVLGIKAVVDIPVPAAALIIAAITFALLWTGKTEMIEKIMTVLVFIMVILFVITAIVVKPDFGRLVAGLIPRVPSGAILVTIGVVGTTVIPHLLFLHSSLTSKKWANRNIHNALIESNFDTIFSMVLCGLITICVIITGASMFGTGVTIANGLDMAKQLEPLAGSWAKYVFGIGLFAAGITSSLSAPMSAAYALCSVMRWSTDMKDKKFRIIWIIVLLAGTIVTASGYSPVTVILSAQAFNGIMLPISAIILMIMANNKQALGEYSNNRKWNILGFLVILVTIVLGIRTMYNVLPTLFG